MMAFNNFGNFLRLTTFGESHGQAIGGILDGMPAGVSIDIERIKSQLSRRRPGQSHITTSRSESDEFTLLSGLLDGTTTGHPIGFQILNSDQKSADYSKIKTSFRPSHADYTYFHKYGIIDHNGGGRSSARETANWVLAGAISRHLIPDIEIYSFVSSVGDVQAEYHPNMDLKTIDSNIVRCPTIDKAEEMIQLIESVKSDGDSIGGIITTVVRNVPIGLGEPIFHKLEAELARAMLTINAVKGFEIGSGFGGTKMRGSQHNDIILESGRTKTNYSGGIQGGISNGMEIVFRTAFKPTSTIQMAQDSIDHNSHKITIEVEGRHDPCVVPRAVPIVDALTALVLADMSLLDKTRRYQP
jgi:chorismate synthase